MTSIRLPATLEQKLRREAQQRKVSKSEIIKTALYEYLQSREATKNPYSLGAELFGKYGSGRADDSASYKKRIKEKLHEKFPD